MIPSFSHIPEDTCLPHLPRTNAWEMEMSIKWGCHSNPNLMFAVNRKTSTKLKIELVEFLSCSIHPFRMHKHCKH